MLSNLRRLILIILTLLITPALATVAATLLLLNLVHRLAGFMRKPIEIKEHPTSGLASIIILNWNGKDLLAEGLPSVLEAVETDGRPHEVIVVDNGSSDGSVEYLSDNFPGVRILPLPKNLGFAEGNNFGIRAARHDIVVLLNNDMVVDRGFLKPLLEGFSQETFAVSSQIYHQDPSVRREETGKTVAVFRRGMIDYGHSTFEEKSLPRRYYPTFWAGGGSSAFHRERFLQLGGFHAIYSPAYVEDTDISYRAWKKGWILLFAPDSVVYHKHRASCSRRFTHLQLRKLIQRNQFLFIWKNMQSWSLLLSHCGLLPWNCYRLARDFGIGIWTAPLQAILRLPRTQIAKLGSPFREVRSDHEIFRLFEMPGLFFRRRPARWGMPAEDPLRDDTTHSRTGTVDRRPSILWITAYLPHLGRHAGAGRMIHLLKRLARRYRISLLSFLESEEEREFLPELASICERVTAIRRLPPWRWQLFAYEPFEEFRTPAMEEALQNFLEHYDFDLIQLEYSQMACYAHGVFEIPTLLTKHEVDFAACSRRIRLASNPLQRLKWFYRYLQVLDREIALLRRVDAAICMTDPDRAALQRYCSSVPVHVINTGVDLDYFTPPEKRAAGSQLVFVGAFQHEPNVDAMLFFCRDILPRIREQISECKLLIVGSNPPPVITGLSDIPGVRVTGFVPDIRPFMASSDVYVVPLRLGVGIRGKILEAWAMELPVVATSVACSGLSYQENQNLLLADTGEVFASHVISLLRDPSRRERLGAAGRSVVERQYGWDVAARQLDSLYQQYIRR